MEGERGAGGDGELAAAAGALEPAPAERVAVENAAMRADGLALGLRPAELAEGRVGFLFADLDEVLDRHVPAFRGHQEVLAVLVFHTPACRCRDRGGYYPTTDAPESSESGGAFGIRGASVHVQAPGLAVVDTRGDAAASEGRRNQRRMRIRLNMRRAPSGSRFRSRSDSCNLDNWGTIYRIEIAGHRLGLAPLLRRTLRCGNEDRQQ